VGVFVALLGVGQLLGPVIVLVCLSYLNLSIWCVIARASGPVLSDKQGRRVHPVLMGVLGMIVLVSMVVLVRNYSDFVPNILIPFMPTSTRLLPSLSAGETLAQPLMSEQPLSDIRRLEVCLALVCALLMGTDRSQSSTMMDKYRSMGTSQGGASVGSNRVPMQRPKSYEGLD
jgi:hypothetical protein